jgi:hypothetical protein
MSTAAICHGAVAQALQLWRRHCPWRIIHDCLYQSTVVLTGVSYRRGGWQHLEGMLCVPLTLLAADLIGRTFKHFCGAGITRHQVMFCASCLPHFLLECSNIQGWCLCVCVYALRMPLLRSIAVALS